MLWTQQRPHFWWDLQPIFDLLGMLGLMPIVGGEPVAQILAIGTTRAEHIPPTIFFKDYI